VSNLSDLIPAGASAKQLTFTDSGSGITTKKPVILNSDGTVTEVSTTSVASAVGSLVEVVGYSLNSAAMAYSTVDNKMLAVLSYNAGSGNDAYYSIGTYNSGTPGTYTWTTPALFRSAGYDLIELAIAYSPDDDKFLITAKHVDDNNYGTSFVAEIDSGLTTVTMAVPVNFYTNAPYGVTRTQVIYDTNASKFLVAYIDNSSDNYVRARVGSLSGSTISYGTELEVDNSNQYYELNLNYSTTDTKSLVSFAINSGAGYSRVLTVSGTNVTTGAVSSSWANSFTSYMAQNWDALRNVFLVHLREWNGSTTTNSIAGTISGTSVSFGTTTVIWSTDSLVEYAAFDPNKNKSVVITSDYTAGAQEAIEVEVASDGTITSASPFEVFGFANVNSAIAYDPDSTYMAVLGNDDDSGSSVSESRTYRVSGDSANLTAANFVGVADSAISASAAGSVIVQGGTISGLSSLTTGSSYYVQTDGTFGTSAGDPSVKAGLAISTTSLLLNGDS
tara:strand:+ start:1086 stop:2594 length:1509 start_codon:yes stop_codon:yes gene_type:complete